MLRLDEPRAPGTPSHSLPRDYTSWLEQAPASARSATWLSGPTRVHPVLCALAAERAAGWARAPAPGPALPVEGLQLEADQLCLRLSPSLASCAAPLQLRLGGWHFGYEAEVHLLGRDGAGRWRAPLPGRLLRWGRRAERRQPAPEGLTLSLLHPLWARLPLRLAVREVSAGGVAFDAEGLEEALSPGQQLPQVALTWDGGVVELAAQVAHLGRAPDGTWRCGLRLVGSASERARWRQAVLRWRYPRTRLGQTWAEASWALYESSGYFGLSSKSPSHFAHLRRAFAVASRRLDGAPELGCQVVWPSPRGLEASLSLLRVYAGTGLLYQLARRRDGQPEGACSARQMLREVSLHALEHAAAAPQLRWLLVYVQQEGARWSRLAYRSFAQGLPPAWPACVVPFRALEVSTAGRRGRGPAGLEVGRAEASERRALLCTLAARRPAPWCEALDFTPEQLALPTVSQAWGTRGFTREREVLVAREGGVPLAAAVLECAQEGVHLFGLLDVLRLVPLAEGGARAEGALLEAARAWYRARGRERFVLFAEEGDMARPVACGMRDLGPAHLIAFSRALLPDFLEHLLLITAPRLPAAPAGGSHV